MGPRPLLALSLGWLLVVAVVAAVTFVVVDRAGRGVGQASAARTVAPLPTDGAGQPTPSSSATDPPTPAPTDSPTVQTPTSRTVSFTTPGGTVVATCVGTTLSLGSITPFDGWRFEKDSEDGGLEVAFVNRGDGDDEVEIVLACVDGSPERVSK
ncbi:MAG: hypothetical protein WBL35_16450 [Ornithinibacter sp.]